MLHRIAEDTLKHIGTEGEVYVSRAYIRSVYVDGSKISNAETKTDTGMSVRVSDNGRMGRASVTVSGDDDAASCVKMASDLSRYSPRSKEFKGFAMPSAKTVTPFGIFDRKIADASTDDLISAASSVIDSCDTDIPRGLVRLSVIESVLMNTNGVCTEHKSTSMYGHFTSMAKAEHPGEGVETVFGTKFDIDPGRIGASLSVKAKAAASAKPFKGKRSVTMILPPCELGDMIMSSAGSALNGENVMYRRSLWKDRVEKEVASECITMTDDPSSSAPMCSSFDDEGTPSSKKTLIENGILKGFLNDCFTGGSTGNGMRRSPSESQGIYENPVSIKPMNLTVSEGRYSQEDIIAQTDDGILVEKFAWPECDPLTGRFGLEVRSGHMIRNGIITGTIGGALLMGNMIDALRRAELVGNDSVCTGCATVPTVSFSGLELIGN